MDYYKLKAEAIDKNGKAGIYSINVHERDSECTSEDEWLFTFQMSADHRKMKIVGPMQIECIDKP